jgi:ribosomal RNA-processing protein 17
MPPPSFKKRKTTTTKAPAEITFDFAAREEYLTGFHKRKVQRIKHAQEENAKKENEERLRMRKEVCITLFQQTHVHATAMKKLQLAEYDYDY